MEAFTDTLPMLCMGFNDIESAFVGRRKSMPRYSGKIQKARSKSTSREVKPCSLSKTTHSDNRLDDLRK